MNTVTDKQLELLNGWPEGTVGFDRDKSMLTALNELCKLHGYGAVAQAAAWIEELWRDREGTFEKFEAMREERLSYAEDARIAHFGTAEEKKKRFGQQPEEDDLYTRGSGDLNPGGEE